MNDGEMPSTDLDQGPGEPNPGETLGARVGRLMVERGFSQTELGKRAGIDRSEISRIVNDKRHAQAKELPWLAQALSVTLEDLLQGLELPEALAEKRVELEQIARSVLVAKAEAEELRAQLLAVDQDREQERQKWSRERLELNAQLQAVREDAASRVAGATKRADSAEQALDVERTARAEERGRFEAAIQQLNVALLTQRQQVATLQQEVAREKGSKVTVGLLASLVGLVGGAALAQNNEELDEEDEN